MKFLLFCLLLVGASVGFAQTAIPGFTLDDVTKGASVSLQEYASRPAVVVIFTSNACPFDNSYKDRIGNLITQYADRVPILLVNSHLDGPESESEMKKVAAGWSFQAPYLSDKSQVAMEALGARRSPEAYLLKPGTGGFTIVYSGAIDDNPQAPGAVTARYLEVAIESLLTGKPATPSVRSAGCSIRRK